MNNFDASSVDCYEEDGVLIVAIGDDAVDPRNFLIISRLDDEDNSTVDDGIGLQTAGADYEMASAIKKVILEENSLKVEVKPEFVKHFGGGSIIARLSGEESEQRERISSLRKSLQVIFDGSNVELVV